MQEENKIVELKDEDLEKVSGGTSYSGSSYRELNIPCNHTYQIDTNHPVITTNLNWCNLPCNKNNTYCQDCGQYQRVISGFSGYCSARSHEYDPAEYFS